MSCLGYLLTESNRFQSHPPPEYDNEITFNLTETVPEGKVGVKSGKRIDSAFRNYIVSDM